MHRFKNSTVKVKGEKDNFKKQKTPVQRQESHEFSRSFLATDPVRWRSFLQCPSLPRYPPFPCF